MPAPTFVKSQVALSLLAIALPVFSHAQQVDVQEHTLKIRYQGACGSCPSSLSGTLMAIEGMLKAEVDPEMEVVAV